MSTEKILDRVRKLLAVANDERGNETERETALRHAHKLLTQHGLSLQNVEEHARDKVDPRGIFDEEGWSMQWARQIRMTIAGLFMVKYFVGEKINGTKSKQYFVGRESNAVTAMYMSSYVINNILKEGRQRYGHNLSPDTRSFAVGCADRLRERAWEMRKNAVREYAARSKALALVDVEKAEANANESFISAAGWSLSTIKGRSGVVNSSSYNDGKEHANTIGLNVQVAKPDDQLLLGRD